METFFYSSLGLKNMGKAFYHTDFPFWGFKISVGKISTHFGSGSSLSPGPIFLIGKTFCNLFVEVSGKL